MCGGKWDFLSVNRLVCLFHRHSYFQISKQLVDPRLDWNVKI